MTGPESLSRWDLSYTTADGLFSSSLSILDDRNGFWMSCNRGIFRVSRKQLEDFANGKLRRITSVPFGKMRDSFYGV